MSCMKVVVVVGLFLVVGRIVKCLPNTISLPTNEHGFGPGRQDWGFVEVRNGAHKFWWLYLTTANEDPTTRPLAIWLQGGPGASSTGFGNFEEIGPLTLDLSARNYTWVRDMNVLFIDSPVGSGFSYVENPEHFTLNNTQIANDLVELMRGFYTVHPEFEKVALHIFGESYGGKVAIEFAYKLHQAIKQNSIKSNLKSVNSIDGWISPIHSVLSWAPFLANMGFVNTNGHDRILQSARETQRLLNIGKFKEATTQWGRTESVIYEVTGAIDFYNVLKAMPTGLTKSEQPFPTRMVPRPGADRDPDEELHTLMNGLVRDALNISKDIKWGAQSEATFSKHRTEFMKPVISIVELLLNTTEIDVNIITGQLDLIVATPGTVEWVKHMKWKEVKQFEEQNRNAISCNGVLEGYSQVLGRFGFYWVHRAGHMVPLDNPLAMDTILQRITNYEQ